MDTKLVIALVLAIACIFVSIITLYQAIRANTGVRELHVLINSRLTELLALNRTAAIAEGRLQVKTEGEVDKRKGAP